MKHLLILIMCGIAPFPPLPPIGCSEMRPVCICDSNGNCDWSFVCEKD